MGILKKSLQRIFKFITSQIFFLMYGKVDKIINPEDDKRIKVDKVTLDNVSYKVFTVESGRLYTDTIHDTAIILEKKIINGPSFQLRNNNNDICEKNIVLRKGTPRLKKKVDGNVLSLLTGGGGNENYWHWLFDVLPRIKIVSEVYNISEIDFFLVPNDNKNFQIESLQSLGINKEKVLSSKIYRHIETNKLFSTNHPYVINNDQFNDMQKIPIWIFNWLKKKLLNDNSISKNKNFPKKIYIDRSDTNKNLRFIVNENQIKEYLESQDFQSICLTNFHFKDQIKIFNNADCIVGLHGAGFANLVFCKPETNIIEFKAKTTGEVIGNLAKKNKLKYNFIFGDSKESTSFHQQGSLKINLKDLREKLKFN